MLLLYQRRAICAGPMGSIYIPLCFYFITLTPIINHYPDRFTFHYASTLSEKQQHVVLGMLNLHSTMLLLYLCWDVVVASNISIYIPLCFYFIHGNLLLPYPDHQNLHSTMLLLYLVLLNDFTYEQVYLHSTMLLLYLCRVVYRFLLFLHFLPRLLMKIKRKNL